MNLNTNIREKRGHSAQGILTQVVRLRKTVPAVPVPRSVPAKTVPTVPVSGSGSVHAPP